MPLDTRTLEPLYSQAQLDEACALLSDVHAVLGRVLASGSLPTHLACEVDGLHDKALQIGIERDGPPIAEAVRRAEDLRQAIRTQGFDISDPLVAVAWSDMVTALDLIFDWTHD